MIERTNVWSPELNSYIDINYIIPKNKIDKIMILLHGKIDTDNSKKDIDDFIDKLELEKLSEKFGVAIAIPLMKNCYYISSEEYRCDNFIAKELPELTRKYINVSAETQLILGGVSMGGYGAMLIAAAQAKEFDKVISISGSFIAHDVAIGDPRIWGELKPDSEEVKDTFIESFLPLDDIEDNKHKNPIAALRLLREGMPMVVLTCGTKEWLYSRNKDLMETLDKLKMRYKFIPIEEGKHELECFREGLWKAMKYFRME